MRIRLLLCLALCVLLAGTGCAYADTGISNLELTAEDSTRLLVSWDNPQDASCEVRYYVSGLDTYYSVAARGGSAVLYLVPGMAYRIAVLEEGAPDGALEAEVEMPEAETYRENGYKVSKRRVYCYDDAERAMWNQSYSHLGTVSKEELLQGIEDGKIYALYFEVSFKKTSEPKEIDPMLVLKTPDGDIYTQFDNALSFDGSWTGARYYISFNELVGYCDEADGLVPGKYTMEIYQDGMTLGAGEFTVKD